MAYSDRLQTNNINLQNCINKANALPDAGSGGGSGEGVESCELSYNAPAGITPSPTMPVITFTSPEMIVETYEFNSGDNHIWALAKNTIVIVQYIEQAFPVYGLGELIFSGAGYQAIKITGDCTFGSLGGTDPA